MSDRHLLVLALIAMNSLLTDQVSACTAAYHVPSNFMFKSYDWHDGDGDLYFNPREVTRSAFPHESRDPTTQGIPHSWRSRLASVSFNQYGRGFPNGGMNEAGLAIEVLWLNETQAPDQDARPYLNELEWVQYVLDRHKTVADVIKAASQVRISPIHGQVHYMMCDAQGNCATLELLKGQLVVHTGDQLPHPVLTNHTYQQGLAYLKSLKRTPRAQERGSLARFAIAASTAAHPEVHPLIDALKALVRVEIKGYTKWQIGYDLNNRQVAFRTARRSMIRKVNLGKLIDRAPHKAIGCEATLTYPLSGREKGDVTQLFQSPHLKRERQQLRKRLKRLKLSTQLADLLAQHGARCLPERLLKSD